MLIDAEGLIMTAITMNSIAVCGMFVMGIAAAHPETALQKFRLAKESYTECAGRCESNRATCIQPCAGDSSCNQKCYDQEKACKKQC